MNLYEYFKKLVGDRIYLSPRRVEDFEIFTKWMNDFNVTDYIRGSSKVMTLEEEKEYMINSVNKGEPVFSIVKIDNDEIIGTCGLHEIDQISRKSTLGIFIGEDENRSKGYGTEAIRLILDY